MVKYIAMSVAVGGIVFLVGAVIHDYTQMDGLGDTLAVAGLSWVAISLSASVVPLYKKIKPNIETALAERGKSKAYEDLLKYKKLLDENIISQEEYDIKATQLKSKLL